MVLQKNKEANRLLLGNSSNKLILHFYIIHSKVDKSVHNMLIYRYVYIYKKQAIISWSFAIGSC